MDNINLKIFKLELNGKIQVRNHPFSAYAKCSEKLTFLTPWYAHVRMRIRGLEMLVFSENFAYDPKIKTTARALDV